MSALAPDLLARFAALVGAAGQAGLRLTTAESCTGGLVAAHITEVPGSSAVFEYGFVTYANAAKTALVGVPEALLSEHGAVSEAVARAMAEGARTRADAHVAVAVTGIAGPGGATERKPVGLVHFALASAAGTISLERRYGDLGRGRVRAQAVLDALSLLERGVETAARVT